MLTYSQSPSRTHRRWLVLTAKTGDQRVLKDLVCCNPYSETMEVAGFPDLIAIPFRARIDVRDWLAGEGWQLVNAAEARALNRYITILRDGKPTGITFPYDLLSETVALLRAHDAAVVFYPHVYSVTAWEGHDGQNYTDGAVIPLPSQEARV